MHAPIGIDLSQEQLEALKKEVIDALNYVADNLKNTPRTFEQQATEDRAKWEAMLNAGEKTGPATGCPRHGTPGIIGAWNTPAADAEKDKAEYSAESVLDEIAALDTAMLNLENSPLEVRMAVARMWLPKIQQLLNAVRL